MENENLRRRDPDGYGEKNLTIEEYLDNNYRSKRIHNNYIASKQDIIEKKKAKRL